MGEKIHNNQDRIDAYMDRIEDLTDDDRGFSKLKYLLLKRFTINTSDPEALNRLTEGLYESEKRMAIEQGRGADIKRLESTQNVLEVYKPLVLEKAKLQQQTLSSWLDYLQQNDAKQSMEFRYFVVRSLEKMGTLDKEKVTYTKRTSTTIAPFPELNSEALGWVYKRMTEGLDPEEAQDPEKKKKIEAMLKVKDFAKLYALAQVETAGRFNRETIEGEWKKYDKGSDYHILERDLKDKGTGWCTAIGSAQADLQAGDFFVYYSAGEDGKYTQPRVAIRMEQDDVAEVRGVDHRQALEPALLDIAKSKYQDLPGGDKYDKKDADMKRMTLLTEKQEKNEPLTREDLIFLYELDSKIEGFGYDRDDRIEKLRKQRDPNIDIPVIFDCEAKQIARTSQEVNEHTKAYVGPLTPGIFTKISHLEYIYPSFPEGGITRYSVEIGGKTPEQLENDLEQAGFKISYVAHQMMRQEEFKTAKDPEQADLVRLTVGDLFNDENGHTTDDIYKRADQIGLELCPAEVGPHLRLKLTDQVMNDWFRIAMKQIADSGGDPYVFFLGRDGDGSWLFNRWTGPTSVRSSDEFVFRLRSRK